MIAGEKFAELARAWVGVPFLHQGRTRRGVDCIGFVCALLDDAGECELIRHLPVNYSRAPQAELLEGLKRNAVRLPGPVPGAVALIKWPRSKHPSHVGIIAGANIIHSYQRVGRVVEHGFREPWPARTDSFWQVLGVKCV